MPWTLDVVEFPALVIADDGWVEEIGREEDLSAWTPSAIAKYSKERVLLYDSAGRAWQIDNIASVSKPKISTRLSALFFSRKMPVKIAIRPIMEAPLEAVRSALFTAIDADDDALTQFTEADDLKEAVQKTDSFAAMIRVLKEKRAI